VLEETYFQDFISAKTDILDAPYQVDPGCYIDNYLPTSILNRAIQLNIYPNPARTVTSFDLETTGSGTAFIKVTDMSGRVMKQWNKGYTIGKNNFTLGISNIDAGSYILDLTLSDSKRRYSGKLVVID
jgi:hypothetical protein